MLHKSGTVDRGEKQQERVLSTMFPRPHVSGVNTPEKNAREAPHLCMVRSAPSKDTPRTGLEEYRVGEEPWLCWVEELPVRNSCLIFVHLHFPSSPK